VPSQSAEDYLEALYRLHLEGEPIRTSAIARALKLSPASVTEMLQHLATKGYLQYRRYKGVSLTAKGVDAATSMVRRRGLLTVFLVDVLGMGPEAALEEAHRMEHALSDEVEQRLCSLLGNPQHGPVGDEDIPLCPQAPDECPDCQRRGYIPLTSLAAGHRGSVQAVLDDDLGSLGLGRLGLGVGAELRVLRSSPEAVTVLVRGKRARLGWEIAQHIVMRRLD
jgi:DtxR family Mn-dependent transcriptional regulator